MTTNITLLALNLLISERLVHRTEIAEKITALVYPSSEATAKDKADFFMLLAHCVENPASAESTYFYQLAQYYNQKINGDQSNLYNAA